MNKTFSFDGSGGTAAVTDPVRDSDTHDYFSGMKILGRPARESDRLAGVLEALADRDQGIDPSERASADANSNFAKR